MFTSLVTEEILPTPVVKVILPARCAHTAVDGPIRKLRCVMLRAAIHQSVESLVRVDAKAGPVAPLALWCSWAETIDPGEKRTDAESE
jgi:hypothetical protein